MCPENVQLMDAMATWVTVSKKKKLDTRTVFISRMVFAAMIASRLMMFMARMMFNIKYPGLAKGSFGISMLKGCFSVLWP